MSATAVSDISSAPFTAPSDLNKPAEPAKTETAAAPAEEHTPQPEINLSLSQQVVEVENTRNILSNTLRLLKEASFPGTMSMQVVQSINLIHAFFQQMDANLKQLKKQLAQEVNTDKKK